MKIFIKKMMLIISIALMGCFLLLVSCRRNGGGFDALMECIRSGEIDEFEIFEWDAKFPDGFPNGQPEQLSVNSSRKPGVLVEMPSTWTFISGTVTTTQGESATIIVSDASSFALPSNVSILTDPGFVAKVLEIDRNFPPGTGLDINLKFETGGIDPRDTVLKNIAVDLVRDEQGNRLIELVEVEPTPNFPNITDPAHSFTIETDAPTVELVDFDPGDPDDPDRPAKVDFIVQDIGSGLTAIDVVVANNVEVTIPDFTVGTNDPVLVSATKIDNSTISRVELAATDRCNNTSDPVDPVITLQTREAGKPVSETFIEIPQEESNVTVINGDLGIKNLLITVNGGMFRVTGLKDNQERFIDVSSAMIEGDNNVIELMAWGKPGSSATVMISD